MSDALRHAHENDLVHGALDLSKVLLQRVNIISRGLDRKLKSDVADKLNKIIVRQRRRMFGTSSVYEASGLQRSFTMLRRTNSLLKVEKEPQDAYNFHVINYEPWTVEKLVRRYEAEDPAFERITAELGVQPTREGYKSIAKVLDL